MVLALARPSEPWCLPPRQVIFFEPVLLLAAASNRIYRKIAFFQADAAAVSATAAVQQLAARKIVFF